MLELDQELQARLSRFLLIRDLASVARHAMEAEPASDAVEIAVRFDAQGMSLDVSHEKNGVPLAGWGYGQ